MDDEFLLDIEAPPLPPVEKVYDFYVTTAGGMEDVVLSELQDTLTQITQVRVEKGRRIGRIFFRYTRSPQKLLALRGVENVFALLAEFGGVTVGQPGLLKVAKQIGNVDLIPAAVLHDILHGLKEEASFQLSCTVGKGHRFAASELHQMVQAVLTLKYNLEPSRVDMPYQVQVQLRGKRGLVGLQLSGREQRKRAYRFVEVDGDLPPSVAYCLGKLARVQKHHVCLDVRCGGGTTLIELGTRQDTRGLVGIEAYPDVVFAARENAQIAELDVHFATSDPEAIPVADATIDRAICNLMRRKGEPPIGLGSFFEELTRVLKKDGVAIVVAEDRDVMKKMLDDFPHLYLTKRRTLHLRGKHPDVYILAKRR